MKSHRCKNDEHVNVSEFLHSTMGITEGGGGQNPEKEDYVISGQTLIEFISFCQIVRFVRSIQSRLCRLFIFDRVEVSNGGDHLRK